MDDETRPGEAMPSPDASELTRMTAAELAAAMAAGHVSALEVTDAHLARIDAAEKELHAFLHVAADSARAAARAVDERRAAGEILGPLAGVPLALKDVFTTTDMPTTCASRILGEWRPPYDATVTRRLRQGGVVLLGKTNMDEFAMGSSTENSAYGASRNPWDLARVRLRVVAGHARAAGPDRPGRGAPARGDLRARPVRLDVGGRARPARGGGRPAGRRERPAHRGGTGAER